MRGICNRDIMWNFVLKGIIVFVSETEETATTDGQKQEIQRIQVLKTLKQLICFISIHSLFIIPVQRGEGECLPQE